MSAHGPLPAGDPGTARVAIASHPFCAGLDATRVSALADGAGELSFAAGDLVLQHGHDADALYLLLEGDVSVEVADPAHETLTIETLHAGDPLGWSWLYPPRVWAFDARCLGQTRAVRVDADHLRRLIDDDPAFGRDLALRMGRVVVERLQFARAQLVEAHLHDHR
jgi:CRP/FNR family transcriptional regulator, cyclic AMP receptor protein